MTVTAIKKHFIMLILLAGTLALPLGSVCLAGGGQHYPNGTTDFVMGALPPAGTYLENHTLYVNKDSLLDNSGEKLPVDLSVEAVADAVRLIHVTPYTLFGASWAMHTIIPFYSTDFELKAGPVSIDSDDANLGDICFSPLVLGWHHSPNFHQIFALDIYAPNGHYENDDPSTQIFSRNHWTIEPVLATTYLYKGFDFSAKLMYDFHTKNNDYLNHGDEVELQPGQEFHFDWAVGYAPKSGWRLGLVGYNHWQTTDDEIDGEKVDDDRTRLAAIGLGIKYWPEHGPFSLTFKHYWEYGGKNVAEGQVTHMKIQYAF